ncbi:MAG: CBS domain-containing protein [Desulfobulbaceae bacterium]|nr:CBS domain-containing protein [Desulfobulbaceae bacterium]
MLKAKDIMTTEVITVEEDRSVKELAKILAENKISGVPVVDNQGKIVGIVTESDLIDRAKKVHIPTVMRLFDSFVFLESPERMEKDLKKMAASTAKDICNKKVISVTPVTPLDELATLMSENKVHTIPVLDNDKLVGIIGKTDIIRTLVQGDNT